VSGVHPALANLSRPEDIAVLANTGVYSYIDNYNPLGIGAPSVNDGVTVTAKLTVGDLIHQGEYVTFFNHPVPAVPGAPAVTGLKGGLEALDTLIKSLSSLGLIVDGRT
jgi:hypothetical protein